MSDSVEPLGYNPVPRACVHLPGVRLRYKVHIATTSLYPKDTVSKTDGVHYVVCVFSRNGEAQIYEFIADMRPCFPTNITDDVLGVFFLLK